MSTARKLLEELRGDEGLRRELAEELLPEVLRSKELRRIILVALYKEIATKEDIESLRNEIKRIEGRLSMLEQRAARLEGMLGLFVKLFIAFNIPILIGIIGILLKMVFG